MNKLSLFLLVIFINLTLSQRLVLDNVLEPGHHLANANAITPGVKKVEFSLEVTNGKAIVLAMSATNYELYKSGKEYYHYVFVSDQPFSSLHMTSEALRFLENYYLVLESTNLFENIHVVGYIQISENEIGVFEKYLVLFSIMIGLGCLIAPCLIGIFIYRRFCKKRNVEYASMAIMSDTDVETE